MDFRDITSLGYILVSLLYFAIPLGVYNMFLLMLLPAMSGIAINDYSPPYLIASSLFVVGLMVCSIAFLGLYGFAKFMDLGYLKYGALLGIIAIWFMFYSLKELINQHIGHSLSIISYLPYALTVYVLFVALITYGFIELYEVTAKTGFLLSALLMMFVPMLAFSVAGFSLIELGKELSSLDRDYFEGLRKEVETIVQSIPTIPRKQLAMRLGVPEIYLRIAYKS